MGRKAHFNDPGGVRHGRRGGNVAIPFQIAMAVEALIVLVGYSAAAICHYVEIGRMVMVDIEENFNAIIPGNFPIIAPGGCGPEIVSGGS